MEVTFLRDNAQSRNKRLYTAEAVQNMVQQAQTDIARGTPLTVFSSHDHGLSDDASAMAGRVENVWREPDGRARARIQLFDTDAGRNIAAVVKGGGLNTISLRSNDFRSTPMEQQGERWERIDMVHLAGIDFTLTPGVPDAKVDHIALEAQRQREGRLW